MVGRWLPNRHLPRVQKKKRVVEKGFQIGDRFRRARQRAKNRSEGFPRTRLVALRAWSGSGPVSVGAFFFLSVFLSFTQNRA